MSFLRPARPRPQATDDPVSLARVPVGWRRRIVVVDDAAREELEHEGLLPGVEVVVTSRTPLGGPVVVEVGRARLALSAAVAGLVHTQPLVHGRALQPVGPGSAAVADTPVGPRLR